MAAWITLTAQDLDPYLLAVQSQALRTVDPPCAGADRFSGAWLGVSSQIRGQIQKNRHNRLDAEASNSIPPELRKLGAVLCIESMQAAFPDGFKPTDEQKSMFKWAAEQLEKLKEEPVTRPDVALAPTVVYQGTEVPEIVRHAHRTESRHSMKSL